jgi:porin
MGIHSCLRQKILYLVVYACSMMSAPVLAAGSESGKKLSLIEVAPSLYHTAKRSQKYYGDPNTTHGSLSERNYLFGNPDDIRDRMNDHGIYLDFGVTQFLQNNLDGGVDDSTSSRTNGSSDLYLWFDTGKADWWSGGALFAHAEWNWGTGMSADTGSLLPVNFDEVMPSAVSPDGALSELYFMQALPNNLILSFGKQDFAAWADTNTFANSERTQFTYLGFVSNPIAGVFFPYTSIGGWVDWAPNKKHNFTWVWAQAEGVAGTSGLNDFDGQSSYAVQYIHSTEVASKPGNYLIAAAYSNKNVTNFDISRGQLLGELTGELPVADKSDNYAIIGNLAQYLWIAPEDAQVYRNRPHSSKARHTLPSVGAGIFARFGLAPDDRNAIDQFYSIGFGGFGMLIKGRDADNWGIGWAGSHISSNMRHLDDTLEPWEHSFEVFYNFALTPAMKLSLNGHSINTASDDLDTSYSFTSRLQINF